MAPIKIDHDAIKNLADLLTETDLSEIEISEGDKSIRVARTVSVHAITAPTSIPAVSAANSSDETSPASKEDHPGAVKSPMVGTAYLQPSPESAKFVEKGDSVKKGDTLLIVEAMKVMNPIKAEKNGTVADILVEDSQPVEFGQVLIIVE